MPKASITSGLPTAAAHWQCALTNAFVRLMALENPKNYQIWHHRRVIVEMLGDGSLEGAFTEAAFDQV